MLSFSYKKLWGGRGEICPWGIHRRIWSEEFSRGIRGIFRTPYVNTFFIKESNIKTKDRKHREITDKSIHCSLHTYINTMQNKNVNSIFSLESIRWILNEVRECKDDRCGFVALSRQSQRGFRCKYI